MSDSTNYTGRVYNDPAYRIAKSMYIAIGGDASITFENTDEIYEAINGMYAESGGRIAIEPLNMLISSNGPYTFNDEDITGYKPVSVTVDVPQKWTDEQVTQLQQDSYNNGYSEGETKGYNNGYTAGNTDGYTDGYADGVDDGAADQKALLESIEFTENGTYTKEDGWNEVVVKVAGSGGGGVSGLDFESIGWSPEQSQWINKKYNDDLAYTQQKLEEFNNTSDKSSFNLKNDKKIVFAPKLDYNYNNATLQTMFYGCCSLNVGPIIENLQHILYSRTLLMFSGCTSLQTVPQFDTSKVTNMSEMFSYCSSLTTVPQFDTSSATNMSSMFNNCESLTTVPQFDTSSVTNMSSMFSYCSSLTTVPQFDTSKVSSISSMFSSCTNLTDVGGLINLGMQSNLSTPTSKYSGIFYNCKNITRESVINIFNGLYDRAAAGYSNLTLIFEPDVINRLTEDDIAIATNKGWTISQ